MGELIPLQSNPAPNGESISCPRCNAVLPAETNFCPKCGYDVRGRSGADETFRGIVVGKVIDGRYRLLEKLGEGGMGSVFKVEHTRMGKVMALKVLRSDLAPHPSVLARFRTEARVVSKLSHPNTISVFDFGELEGGGLFIAMEYVQGSDLFRLLEKEGALPERRVAQAAVQVLHSLAEAHEAGIVHRDIKPGNVMVTRTRLGEDWVKVVDFGIAKLAVEAQAQAQADKGKGQKNITGVAEFVGTPNYCSPEQARGEEPDPRSDLYSLGAMLFELVAGSGPYEGPTPMAVVSKHISDPVPSLRAKVPSVSEAFDLAVQKALSKRPADRFQNADEMRRALESIAGAPVRLEASPRVPVTGGYSIASREDWDSFEKSLRRGLWVRNALGPLGVLLAMGAVAWFGWKKVSAPKVEMPVTTEVEINDDVSRANLIALDTDVTGSMGEPHKAGKSDEDMFRVEVPNDGELWVSLSGVQDLNLVLEIIDADRQARHEESPFTHAMVDDGRLGESELLGPYPAHAGRYYLRVSERPAYDEADQTRPPRERANTPYTLKVHAFAGSDLDELEPNDTPSTAQAITFAKPLMGHAGRPLPDHALEHELTLSALDYFSAPTPTSSGTSSPTTIAFLVQPPDRALGIWDTHEIQNWRAGAQSFLTRKNEFDQRLREHPQDKELQKEAKRLSAPFLPSPVRANSDGVLARRLSVANGKVELLVAPFSGRSPEPDDVPYGLALAHSGSGGLDGVLALARELAASNRAAAAKALLKVVVAELPNAADIAQAKAQLAEP